MGEGFDAAEQMIREVDPDVCGALAMVPMYIAALESFTPDCGTDRALRVILLRKKPAMRPGLRRDRPERNRRI